ALADVSGSAALGSRQIWQQRRRVARNLRHLHLPNRPRPPCFGQARPPPRGPARPEHPPVVLIESGGDNFPLTFSPALVDFFTYVIDGAAGDKIPRKNGPGITQSDILVINKMDLAPHVGASLEVMARDSQRMRGHKPF